MLRAFKQIVFFYVLSLLLAILVFSCTRVGKLPTIEASCSTTLPTQIKSVETNGYRFYILSDWGFNGHFQQLEVAQAMSVAAETASPKMIISCGDNFQVNGVQSVNDPLWMTNFEQVYTHPGLLVDWYAVLGNHDYRGNTQALIDYSGISRRWRMPARYYSFVREINDSTHARFVFLDTPALMSYYWERGNDYPDITKQDSAIQMAWLRETLINASEDWVFVFGHHPLYSASPKHGDTDELIARLEPIFDEAAVDFYFCGHDHDFQHLKPDNSYTDYFVAGTGGRIRENGSNHNTLFSVSKPGFVLVSVAHSQVDIHFISTPGKILYSTKKQR